MQHNLSQYIFNQEKFENSMFVFTNRFIFDLFFINKFLFDRQKVTIRRLQKYNQQIVNHIFENFIREKLISMKFSRIWKFEYDKIKKSLMIFYWNYITTFDYFESSLLKIYIDENIAELRANIRKSLETRRRWFQIKFFDVEKHEHTLISSRDWNSTVEMSQ